VFDLGIALHEALLVLLHVVEGAVVKLGHSVLSAVDIATFTGDFHEAYLFAALPALVEIGLRLLMGRKAELFI
jgi:hypothetical protein